MLTHIVIWKYKPEVSEEERRRHVEMLRALVGIVPEIESFEVGFDVLRLDRSYDTGLVSTFRDRDALKVYAAHPAHVEAADFGRGLSAHVASVDFESEGGAA